MKKYGKDTIQCLESDVKLKVSVARHEKAGSRAEAGVARLEGHSLKHREVLQLITVNRYGMVWYAIPLVWYGRVESGWRATVTYTGRYEMVVWYGVVLYDIV